MVPYYYTKRTGQKGICKVHEEGCSYLPYPENAVKIGHFENCNQAIKQAQLNQPYWTFDGCYRCTPECHEW